ncbi:MAG: ABC transporter permease [Pseudomonadales bacterium]|nr:ABC transporter permease [Pseudomonadales bacterium]MCP5358045.1 ABC transporter permease [Pseudomonadales bacterium]
MLNKIFRILTLCRKEMLAILKDPSSRIVLIMPVFLQSLLFGYAATYDLTNAPYAVLDQSRSGASVELLSMLDGTGVFHRVATLENEQQIQDVIDNGEALLVLQFGPDFERNLYAGQAAPLQVILDARNSNSAGSAAADVGAIVASFNQQWRQSQGGSAPALTIETRAWYNPNLETRWFIMPSMIASLAFLQTVMLTALSVAREREQGTFDQLLVTPMSPSEIMVGKAVPPIMIGLVQSTLVMLVTRFWFEVPMAGALLTLYLGLLFFMVSSVGVGLVISALSANMQQAMLYAFMLMMPLMLLSGLATPVRNMPEPIQILTYANPLRFAIDLIQRVYLEGVSIFAVWHDLVPLTVIALITMPWAAWLFRHRLV